MGKREDAERHNDPMLCSACQTSLHLHCYGCGGCDCDSGESCPANRE